MSIATARSRRHREPSAVQEEQQTKTPFFTKANAAAVQRKPEPFFSTSAGLVQAKLTIGQPGDKYEQEADAVADAVVNQSASGAGSAIAQRKEISGIQRATLATPAEDEKLQSTAEGRMEKDKLIQEKPKEEEEPVQMKAKEEEEPIQMMSKEEEEPVQMKAEEEEEPIQAKSEGGATASAALSSQLSSTKGKGRALSPKTRGEMESAIGADFSGVNVHTNSEAVGMNEALRAQAFTNGSDVYFNAGKYQPESTEGKRLLAHELTHVVQQGAGMIQNKLNQKPKNDLSPNLQLATGAGKDLKSARFAGDAELEACLDGNKVFQSGSKGQAVLKIQSALIDAGFPLPKHGADGSYGSETQKSVRLFQGAIGFKAGETDGIVGRQTMEALDVRFTQPGGKALEVPKGESIVDILKNLLGRVLFMAKVGQTAGFKGLSPNEQDKFTHYVGGFDPYVSEPAFKDFEPKFKAGTFDSTKADSYRQYMKDQPGALQLIAVGPNYLKEKRKGSVVTGPSEKKKFPFRSGKADASIYTVTIDKKAVKVYMPKTPDVAQGNFHTIDEVSKAIGVLPEKSLEAIIAIHVEPKRNPDDAHWAKEYKNPNFYSYMTAGASGVVNIYPTPTKQSQDGMDTSLIHETGHVLSQKRFGVGYDKAGWINWSRAMADDVIRPSSYAKSAPGEDFSESLALFSQVKGTIYEISVNSLMPERAKILGTVLSNQKQ